MRRDGGEEEMRRDEGGGATFIKQMYFHLTASLIAFSAQILSLILVREEEKKEVSQII